jgi:hypothetical protein
MDFNNPKKSVQSPRILIVSDRRDVARADPNHSPPLHNNNKMDPLFMSVSLFVG